MVLRINRLRLRVGYIFCDQIVVCTVFDMPRRDGKLPDLIIYAIVNLKILRVIKRTRLGEDKALIFYLVYQLVGRCNYQ